MDADGEDRPEDVPTLYKACEAEKYGKIIFAERAERSEGVPFKIGYGLYKKCFKILVGKEINFGNKRSKKDFRSPLCLE